ncbi:MAG: dTMP kinase [Candidatus Melainabacteria bacterium]|nr:dTMP kinase [Candidatus Melainabacteria bacterium]
MFITIEGPDKAGKTTQIRKLKEYAKDKSLDWVFAHNPGDTDLGARLREIVLDCDEHISDHAELMIYLADRAHHVETKLKPLLQEGKIIVCDRFSDSTLAYQGYGRGIDVNTIEIMDNLVCDGVKPDLTILLMVSEEEAQRRNKGEIDRLEAQNKLFFVRVRNGYKTLARENPTRIKVIEVDGMSIEEVHERMIEIIQTEISEFQKDKAGV